jgi:hypothetical protein
MFQLRNHTQLIKSRVPPIGRPELVDCAPLRLPVEILDGSLHFEPFIILTGEVRLLDFRV